MGVTEACLEPAPELPLVHESAYKRQYARSGSNRHVDLAGDLVKQRGTEIRFRFERLLATLDGSPEVRERISRERPIDPRG